MGALRQVLDVIQPRALVWGFGRGSWILLCLIVRALRAGLKLAVSGAGVPAPPAKPAPAKVSTKKADAEAAEGEQEAEPAEPVKKQPPKAAAAARAGGDRVEQAGLAVLVVLVAFGGLSGILSLLLLLLRPYMTIVSTVLVLGWVVAALTADVATRPGNDHNELAGEEAEEDTREEGEEEAEEEVEEDDEEARKARWIAARETLRQFVEHQVATGAAGRTEGVRGKGARVDDLLAMQQENGGLPGMERKGMIALLEEAGITVREQMSFRVLEGTAAVAKWKKTNVPGVHVEDLAQDLGRTPRLPAHLVPDLTPGAPPVLAPESAPEPPPESGLGAAHIPAARAAGE